jgi:hypothetical protein
VNRAVFFNAATPRTLDEIYNSFAQKFGKNEAKKFNGSEIATDPAPASPSTLMPLYMAEALSSFAYETATGADNPDEARSGFSKSRLSLDNMLVAAATRSKPVVREKPVYNS